MMMIVLAQMKLTVIKSSQSLINQPVLLKPLHDSMLCMDALTVCGTVQLMPVTRE